MTRILVVDNYDSFVFTLVAYLRELGAVVEVVEGAELAPADALARADAVDGVLVSPGPGRPEDVPTSLACGTRSPGRSRCSASAWATR
jgi:para-aminobenzoate synthetase component 2